VPLYEQSADGVLVTRSNGDVLRANPAACTMLGCTEEALREGGWTERVVDPSALCALLADCERRGAGQGEARFRRADGSSFLAEVTSVMEPGEDARRAAFLVFRVATGRRAAGEGPGPGAAAPAARRGRVAVVDDEPGVRRAVGRALAAAHEVVPFASARALADRIAMGERFDAILCDMMMPDMTGMELHQVLRTRQSDQAEALIFMTGGLFTDEARAFLEAVPNARLEKPFDIGALRALVRSRVAGGLFD
jgi:PAS domain S-box-containing protein